MTVKRIAIVGDWHIDQSWALETLAAINAAGITEVQHVGDFGFDTTPTAYEYLTALNASCRKNGMTINVTEGNHENFPFMRDEFTIPTDDGFLTSSRWDRISTVPRGLRWVREGVEFVSLGGANSINRYSLTPNVDWWADEQISLGDLYRTVEGGRADVMLTHDCPQSLSGRIGSDDGWSIEALNYARGSSEIVEQAVTAVKPRILFHGHYHKFHDTDVRLHDGQGMYDQKVVGLGMNGQAGNVAVLNLANLTYDILKVGK